MDLLYNDEKIVKLANYLGIDEKSLTLDSSSEYEKKLIKDAHKITGDSRFQIANFLSQGIRPKAISPELIFKALIYNKDFYIQYITLIHNTEWMRQEVYNTGCKGTKKREWCFSFLNSQRKTCARKKANNEQSLETVAIAASNDDNQIILQACYQNNTILEFEVVDAMVYLNDSNDRIVILLDISNEDFSSMLEKKYYIELFKNGVEKYKTNVIPNRNGELIEFSTSIPKGIIELGIQWGISEEGK